MGVLMMNGASIIDLLSEIRILLEKYQVTYWERYFEYLETEYRVAKQHNQDWKQNDLLDIMSSLFGGMGSFNDYAITSQHGDKITKREELKVNRRLNELRHQLAVAISCKKERIE